jgi:hypothetical protein
MLTYKLDAAQSDIKVYEFGCRPDKDCLHLMREQFGKANRLYNDIVAVIRSITDEARAHTITLAGDIAAELAKRVDDLTTSFLEARAKQDEDAMTTIATDRRALRAELYAMLSQTRKTHREELATRFWSKIGNKVGTETYRLRCEAVKDGLGWATANATLASALVAQKKSSATGGVPKFRRSAEMTQQSLTLQFTAAGGLPFTTILTERHSEFKINPAAAGRRCYSPFAFRLGSAQAEAYATGTVLYHREVPGDAAVKLVRLTRKRIAQNERYYLQLTVSEPKERAAPAASLVAVHLGWHLDPNGDRVIAGIADAADPGLASSVVFPRRILSEMDRAEELASKRDLALNGIWDAIRPELASLLQVAELNENVLKDIEILSKLPVSHVSQHRLHRLWWSLVRAQNTNVELPALFAFNEWRKTDQMTWQSEAHIGRSARNARRNFYRALACGLAKRFGAIAISAPNLKEAAIVVNEVSGERTELTKKARKARTRVSLSELTSALKAAFGSAGGVLLEVTGDTASQCAHCRGSLADDAVNRQLQHCLSCGAEVERKLNGAAIAWQTVADEGIVAVIDRALEERIVTSETKASATLIKKAKMSEGRRNAARVRSENSDAAAVQTPNDNQLEIRS